jgi:hypothetical protein
MGALRKMVEISSAVNRRKSMSEAIWDESMMFARWVDKNW